MPRITDINGDELKPVTLYAAGGRALGSSTVTVINALAIRDTTARDYVVDCTGYPRRMVAFVNTLNQAVTALVGYSADPVLSVAASERETLSIPASSTRWAGGEGASLGAFLSAPGLLNYSEGLFLRVSCSVAPTSGSLTIYVTRNAF